MCIVFKLSMRFHNSIMYIIQGSHGDWKTWEMKMVMEKSWNFVIQSWNCPQFVLNLYFWSPLRNKAAIEISQNIVNSKLGREMVMENLEMVMENHGKIFCQVWEPC